MIKCIKSCLFIIAFLLGFQSIGQVNYQSEYLSGKNYFNAGNYQMAKNKFSTLLVVSEENPFYLYASYFYGISAYQVGNAEEAIEQYRKVRITYPEWEKINELNVWYGHMLLGENELLQGLEVLNSVSGEELVKISNIVKKAHLSNYDSIPLLQKALELNPYDKILARHLAEVIAEKPLTERPVELLEFLIESFGLEKARYDYVDKNVSQKKDVYNVAVMLPFMAEGLSTTKGTKGNQFILDLYQGIQQAADELNSNGKRVALFAYDTKRDSAATAKILQSGELLEMDLVIGPLYPVPGNLMKEYSVQHRINMVNPLSSNSVIIGSNPYSFLMKSTPETRAKKTAEYVKENFSNKNATIFYGESTQDSAFAYTYKKALEEDSFDIIWMEKIVTAEEATNVLRTLTTVYTEDKDQDGKFTIKRSIKVKVNPEDSLFISKDSLGHIMVASSENILISSILSAVDTRRDQVPVIGFEDWLDIRQISFEQLERMGVIMIGQNYFDFTSPEVANFKEKYVATYNILPTQFSYDGYETMRVFGEKLIDYGNYFQYGIYEEGFFEGYLFYGFNFKNANDNQFVPILHLQDLDIHMLNIENQETENTIRDKKTENKSDNDE